MYPRNIPAIPYAGGDQDHSHCGGEGSEQTEESGQNQNKGPVKQKENSILHVLFLKA